MSTWKALSEIHPNDQALLNAALACVSAKRRPAQLCIDTVHEGELDSWGRVDLSSVDAFVGSFWPSAIFCLSADGFRFFLPLLIGVSFLEPEGWYMQRLVDDIDQWDLLDFSNTDKETTNITAGILDRMIGITASQNKTEIEMYPGLSMLTRLRGVADKSLIVIRNKLRLHGEN